MHSARARTWTSVALLASVALAAGCEAELRDRIRRGDIVTARRYHVAGKSYANVERWGVDAELALSGRRQAGDAAVAWLDSFAPAQGPMNFDPYIRVDFLTRKPNDDYGVYLNKRADLAYICNPATSGLSTGIYTCDPKRFAAFNAYLGDQPNTPEPNTVSGDSGIEGR